MSDDPLDPFNDLSDDDLGLDLVTGPVSPEVSSVSPGEASLAESESDLTHAHDTLETEGLKRGDQIRIGDYVGPLVQTQNTANFSGVKSISHRQKLVATLAAMGFRHIEIAERVGYTSVRVGQLLATPEVSLEVERQRQALFKLDPELSMRTMIPKALEVISEVLHNANEKASLRTETAFRLFERTHGKPKQSIDLGGNLLKDLFEMLDQRDSTIASTARTVPSEDAQVVPATDEPEASTEATQTTQVPSPLDAFVESQFPRAENRKA